MTWRLWLCLLMAICGIVLAFVEDYPLVVAAFVLAVLLLVQDVEEEP